MSDYIHKEFPKSVDPKDFWGQVKRTVNGKPIAQDQIDMIVAAIESGLQFESQDKILDIGCGNGALSHLFFDKVSSLVGVDFSEYLIGIAKQHFEVLPDFSFHLGDALAFLEKYESKHSFSKCICYGVFSYFDSSSAHKILTLLYNDFSGIDIMYIGNLPDRDRADRFYYNDIDYSKMLDDPQSSIGIWRSKSEFLELAQSCGWKVQFHQMPSGFYASHYRFDVVLTR